MHKIIHTIYAVSAITLAVGVIVVIVASAVVCECWDAYQIYSLCR